ncbi:MAG: alpha/beta hydrolase [Pseudomonadota bacterium]
MMFEDFSFTHADITYTGLCNQRNDKPTVVCLHGYLDNAASFIPIAPFLEDFNLVALDMCGHGKSFHRANGHAYHLTDFVFDAALCITSLLQTRKEKKVFLVGHSLGGIVGSILTATYPELIRALVSVEACGPLTADEQTTTGQIKASMESRMQIMNSMQKKDNRTFSQVVKARSVISDIDESLSRLIMSRNCEDSNEGLLWSSDRSLRTKSVMRMTEKQAQNILSSIAVPMLLVLGEQGFEKVKRNLANRVDVMDALVDVKECKGGHYVHMQQPQAVAEQIRAFFNMTEELS